MPLPILLVHLTITLLFVLAWASGLWMDWPERLYQKTKDIPLLWSWMPSLKISETEQNCVRSIRGLCILGMILTPLTEILQIALHQWIVG
jgi:hypothetical protein